MKIGVVQFGNGEITCHGIISLTSDIASVKAAIEGMEYKKGFTKQPPNKSQTFSKQQEV